MTQKEEPYDATRCNGEERLIPQQYGPMIQNLMIREQAGIENRAVEGT